MKYLPHLEWIDDNLELMVSLVESWANIHSGSENLQGLSEMMSSLENAFSSLEGSMKKIHLSRRQRITPNGDIVKDHLGEALCITKHPDAPLKVFLGGHMDIAYLKDQPLEKCQRKNKKTLCGRGTADMKGGLVVMLTALQALEKSPLAGRIGWEVLITPDEEIGSPGSQDLLTQAAKRHQLALIFEPTFPDGSLVSARKGSANFTLVAQGKAAHAGRDFHLGHNAITAVARFALAAESLTNLDKEITVNIGDIKGGGLTNIVPDRAYCRLNVRFGEKKQFAQIKEKLASIVEMENNGKGITMTLHQDTIRPPKAFDAKSKALFEDLKLCAEELDIELRWKSTGGVCDGNILADAGLPTVDTLGVVGGNMHTAEEYLLISSLVERAKLVASFLMHLAETKVKWI